MKYISCYLGVVWHGRRWEVNTRFLGLIIYMHTLPAVVLWPQMCALCCVVVTRMSPHSNWPRSLVHSPGYNVCGRVRLTVLSYGASREVITHLLLDCYFENLPTWPQHSYSQGYGYLANQWWSPSPSTWARITRWIIGLKQLASPYIYGMLFKTSLTTIECH